LEAAFAGSGQEVFNATILVAAVLMLGWHQIWMANHGRQDGPHYADNVRMDGPGT